MPSHPPCAACAHCGCEPSETELICLHPDAGVVGKYARIAGAAGGHCGPSRPKFEQHPGRNPDGSLKSDP